MRIQHETVTDYFQEIRTREMDDKFQKNFNPEKGFETFIKHVGKMIAQDMKIKKITKGAMVKHSKVSLVMLNKILNGKKDARFIDLYKLLRTLGLNIVLRRSDDNCEVIFKGDRGLEY